MNTSETSNRYPEKDIHPTLSHGILTLNLLLVCVHVGTTYTHIQSKDHVIVTTGKLHHIYIFSSSFFSLPGCKLMDKRGDIAKTIVLLVCPFKHKNKDILWKLHIFLTSVLCTSNTNIHTIMCHVQVKKFIWFPVTKQHTAHITQRQMSVKKLSRAEPLVVNYKWCNLLLWFLCHLKQ